MWRAVRELGGVGGDGRGELLQSVTVASDAVAVNAASSVRAANTDSDVPVARRPSRWVRRLISRAVLAVGLLLSAMGVAILLACAINDGAINSSRGESVGEVMDTSPTRTVVRFIDARGHAYIPDNGVLYPAGLQVHQLVRVE